MEFIIWTLIIILFILSMVGIFIPIIPAVLAIWGGFLLYHFVIDSTQLSIFFWIVMLMFTIILLGADLLTNKYFVNRFGGSKYGQWGALVGVIVGAFIYPPFGIIVIPFLIVFLIEIMQHRTAKEASLAALGALAGFLSGAAAKFILQSIMIIWFFLSAFLF